MTFTTAKLCLSGITAAAAMLNVLVYATNGAALNLAVAMFSGLVSVIVVSRGGADAR